MIDASQKTVQPDDTLRTQVDEAVAIIRNSGVIAIPTDTVYGLAASPFDETAVQRIYDIKRRPEHMAMPLLMAEPSDLSKYAAQVPDLAWQLSAGFWPGALTLILPKVDAIPDSVSGGKPTIGLRVPDASIPRTIAARLGSPITGTSANVSGSPSLTTAAEVTKALGDGTVFVLDDGQPTRGGESTVLDLTGDSPRILREGGVSRSRIEAICGPVTVMSGAA